MTSPVRRFPSSYRTFLCSLAVVACFPGFGGVQPARAQALAPEVGVSVGGAYPFRVEDRGFGTHPNIGGSVGLRWRRLGFEVEANRTLGLSPEPAHCAFRVPCVGTAREGLLSATLASVNVLYFFPAAPSRLAPQFYVIGGAGALWSREVTSAATTGPTQVTLSELVYDDTGLAINGGAGVRLRLTDAIVIRPEFRLHNSTAMSASNLSITRFSITAAYQF